jgi:tRNA(Arg) A34 adenosine deaminase TadA
MLPTEIRITNPDWVNEMVDLDRPYPDDDARIRVAIEVARENVLRGTGGPFGAAVFEADTGKLVGVGTNGVLRLNNSSAHAEMVALAMAQARVGHFTLLSGGKPRHELFSSCEPCAMCLGATLWSGVTRLVFAATRDDAMRLGFDEGPLRRARRADLQSLIPFWTRESMDHPPSSFEERVLPFAPSNCSEGNEDRERAGTFGGPHRRDRGYNRDGRV